MSNLIDICFICLKHCNNLVIITSQTTNGPSFEDKLKYFLPGLELNSDIAKYICAECGSDLNKTYEFKQKCLQNITTYEKYAQQVTTTDSCKTDFVCKQEVISDEDDYETNILECKSEITADKAQIEEVFIKEELHEIKGEICEQKVLENPTSSNPAKKRPYTCDFCNKSFGQLSNLKDHLPKHTGEKPFTCEVCSKSFGRIYTLKKHKLLHTGDKPHTCEVCNKSFRQMDHLRRHQLTHSGEKPFSCDVCNQSFRHSHNLKLHKLLHTGEKPHTCEVCNKSFSVLRDLIRHRLIHTGEKPFTCEICSKSFRQFTTLKYHKRLHTGEKPFTCEICNTSFRHSKSLKQHRLHHTGETPHRCRTCDASYTSRQNLQRHLRIYPSHEEYK